MRVGEVRIFIFIIVSLLVIITYGLEDVYTNQWHIKLHSPATEVAVMSIAKEYGFRFHKPHFSSGLEFILEHDEVPDYHHEESHQHLNLLLKHPKIAWAKQIEGFVRVKRGFKQHNLWENLQNDKRTKGTKKSANGTGDPLYGKQWYIHNEAQAGGYLALDLNVEKAWEQGFTGKGVCTGIMDDGIDYMHPDLAENFDAHSSYDFSNNDPYPYPRYTDDNFNSHGTRCAGEIASIRGNGICGVGVAYNSKVAGLRMLDQPYMTDYIEAAAMMYAQDKIDIYSASWGPTDDGKTVDGPRNETMKAIVEGVNRGRGGLGNIFVWASGDGGPNDDCNCDGYAASVWTISINSATNDGETATYDESCSSTLASTFSNGKSIMSSDAGIATVDLYGKCTMHHSGTSAAAPEAAGVFALALEANNKLNWRDVQYLTVLTSKRNHLYDRNNQHNWVANDAGLEFNHLFGYGVLDAGDMTKLAKVWVTVPERFHCNAGNITKSQPFSSLMGIEMTITTDGCKGDAEHEVRYIEHVQVLITLKASVRGDVSIYLTSPSNTTSMILSRRPQDKDSTQGFTKWPFMTTQTWGEFPRGTWTLKVTASTLDTTTASTGTLEEVILVIHGTKEAPLSRIPEQMVKEIPKLAAVKKRHESAKYRR